MLQNTKVPYSGSPSPRAVVMVRSWWSDTYYYASDQGWRGRSGALQTDIWKDEKALLARAVTASEHQYLRHCTTTTQWGSPRRTAAKHD